MSQGRARAEGGRTNRVHFSEIKQQNEERLAGERKRQREAVERIRKQTETEIEFLQSR